MKTNKLYLVPALALLACAASAWAGKKDYQKELQLIRSGLTDQDREIRILSVDTLGRLGDNESLESVAALLGDTSDAVRIKAAVALYRLGDRSGIAELRKILKTRPKLSDNPTPLERVKAVARGTVRAEAASALAEIRDVDSLPLLREMMKDPDGRVADACLIAAGKLGDATAKDDFIAALESTKQEVRAKSAEALAEICDPVTCAALRRRLKDWDRDAKAAAVIALGKLKDKESTPALRELLLDKDIIIREKAATALGLIGAQEAATISALTKILDDPNGMMRLAAVDALQQLGDESGKDFALKALETGDKDAKLKALAILSRIAAKKDIPELQKLMDDPDKAVAISAAKAVILAKDRLK